jgi:protocatechuate 3,4-dioxygenase beta subunit
MGLRTVVGTLAVLVAGAAPAPAMAADAAGTVTGRAIDDAGRGVQHVDVHLIPANGDTTSYGYGFTGADGTYTATGVKPGTYRAEFAPHDGHVLTYAPDAPSARTAEVVTVRAGATTTGVDATLPLGGSIAGRVTDQAGTPLEGIGVDADLDGFAGADTGARGTSTADDGTYVVAGLRPGSYIVGFSGDLGNRHLGEYYPGRPVGDGVTRVTVTAGQTTTGIDAALRSAATLRGRVLGSDGRPLAKALVLADAEPGWGFPEQVATGDDGTFSLGGVAPGPTTVRVTAPTGSADVRQYLGGSESVLGARVLDVGDGASVDVGDVALRAGRFIRGRVTDAAGRGVPSVRVSAARPGRSFLRLRDVSTAADGSYALGGLAPGRYVVAFQPSSGNLMAQYSGASATIGDAAAVDVQPGGDTTGVDAQLAPGATLTGRVTDRADGAGLRWATVTAIPDAPDELHDFRASRPADEDGDYTITGLRPGTYSLRFDSPVDRDMEPVEVGPISVGAGATVRQDATLADATGPLPRPGHASGTVRGTDGAPLAGARVTPVTPSGEERSTVLTDAAGAFTTGDLVDGPYYLRVAAVGRTTTFFGPSPALGGATRVTIAPGATTSGLDVALPPAPGDGAPSDPPGDGAPSEPPGDGAPSDPPGDGAPPADPPGDPAPPGEPVPPTPAPIPTPPAVAPIAVARPATGASAFAPVLAAQPPRATIATARVIGAKTVVLRRATAPRVRLACPATSACRGSVRLLRRTVLVARASFAIGAGRAQLIRPRLTTAGRRLARHRLVAAVEVRRLLR